MHMADMIKRHGDSENPYIRKNVPTFAQDALDHNIIQCILSLPSRSMDRVPLIQ